MAKFAVGQSVEIAFNAPRPDLRVPEQANGRNPGRGDYQTKPDRGAIVEVRETDAGIWYLVEVELKIAHQSATGAQRIVTSHRKRVIHESKLTAV